MSIPNRRLGEFSLLNRLCEFSLLNRLGEFSLLIIISNIANRTDISTTYKELFTEESNCAERQKTDARVTYQRVAKWQSLPSEA